MFFSLAVNKIKQEADVMINIPDTDHGTTSIRIEGSKSGVEKAKKVRQIPHLYGFLVLSRGLTT